MGWIKRNLFFAIGGLVALLLLGAAAYYNYQGWNHNDSALTHLNEIYSKLQQIAGEKPGPGNAKTDNIKTGKEQERVIRNWIDGTGIYFVPIKPVPNAPEVTSEAFAGALRRTVDQLQHDAEKASVQLPPKYGFSFEAQRWIIRFAPGSLTPLAAQLGDVKSIMAICFTAHINALDGIQRVRVSDDDTAGPQTDYLTQTAVTNDHAVLTPYVVTFRGFSSELAAVLAGFASSPHGFVVSAINVAPAGMAADVGLGGQTDPDMGDFPGRRGRYVRGMNPTYGQPAPPPVVNNRGGLPTVLNEHLLRVTLEVQIVKPLPKK